MSEPGWYPDPGGTPGHYRYWDGTTWSPTTSPTPQQPPTPPKKRPTGLIIGIIAATITLAIIAALTIPNLLNNNTNTTNPVETSAPTQTAWDETSTPTQTPPTGNTNTPENPQPTGGNPQNCATGSPNQRWSSDQSEKITGGGLSANKVPVWGNVDAMTMGVSFAYDVQSQSTQIARGWYSNIVVGALKKSDGFTDPKTAASIAMQCMASSDFYTGFYKRVDLQQGATTVDGRSAYRIKSEIYVTGFEPIDGDVVEVIVVDVGNDEYLGVYFGIATIDDPGETLVDTATASLSVS